MSPYGSPQVSPYSALEARFRRRALLGEALAMLQWDSATMMPPGSAVARAEQLAALKLARQELLTDPSVADWLDAAEAAADGLDSWQAANLACMRRDWRHAHAVPPDLVEALTRAGSVCEMVWREARPADDFARLRPDLEAVVALVVEAAEARAAAFGCSRYDALLDLYEPGRTCASIEPLFAELEATLPDLVDRVLVRQATRPAPVPPAGPFPVTAQRTLGRRLMAALGFDFARGRLDVSDHPFTGGVVDDIRITTRYSETDFTQALMATLHETGHALYEAGLPTAWRYQPVGDAIGMAVHESQSLLIEMQVCRGPEFLAYAAPLMREALGGPLGSATGGEDPAWSLDNLTRLYRRVERGLIRVDADEVTYPLHVLARYRLERALLAGDLAVADLPGAWSDAMADLLAVRPPNDRDGCLQDIHWMDGTFGYFPTYTLGAMAAAQLYGAATAERPDIRPAIARGEFRPLLEWLRTRVHGCGRLYDTDQMLVHATGSPLTGTAFMAHLQARYLT